MRTAIRFVASCILVAFMVTSPIYFKCRQDATYRNFHVVQEGVLYRSGQLTQIGLENVLPLYNIRTVISLRDGDDPREQEEERWVRSRGLNFFRIPHRPWVADATGKIPADIGLEAFRKVMDDRANHPVLVHCFAGIHRTGTMCAVYRMDYQGWNNEEAMAEMRALGYTILDAHQDVHEYMTKYR